MTHKEAIAETVKRGWADVTPIVFGRKCELILEQIIAGSLKLITLGAGETWDAAFADADRRTVEQANNAEGVTV
jgi:hypothetical protein